MLTGKKYCIFDFDETIGTLLIDWADWYGGVLSLLQKYDQSLNIPALEVSAQTENDCIRRFGRAVYEDLMEFQQQFEQTHYQGCQKNQVIVEYLNSAEDQRLYMWSNNHSVTIKKAIQEIGLTADFQQVLTCDRVPFLKPDPAGFSQIFVSGSSLTEYLVIGDSENDREMAAAAQIDFLHVRDFERLIAP